MTKPAIHLTTTRHDRDATGMTYVYPVVSRRARGVSVGINLNPNNACNWRCIYCQVPDLQRGGPPPIDLDLLETELRQMLDLILHGDFLERQVPEGMRRLNDIALSGNGEPTSAREFPRVIEHILKVLRDIAPDTADTKLVLITNGSLVHRKAAQAGIQAMGRHNGEVWFKFDRATKQGLRRVNNTETAPEVHFQRLARAASLCSTWIQTCMFALDGEPPPPQEIDAYLGMLTRCREDAIPLKGVLLYGLARAPMQPEAPRLSPVPEPWLSALARKIESLGYTVRVTP